MPYGALRNEREAETQRIAYTSRFVRVVVESEDEEQEQGEQQRKTREGAWSAKGGSRESSRGRPGREHGEGRGGKKGVRHLLLLSLSAPFPSPKYLRTSARACACARVVTR